MSRIRFNGFNAKQFAVQMIQYFVSIALCAYVGPWLGVFVAMIRFEVY